MHTIDPFSESSLEGIELTGFSRVVEGRVEEEGASRPYDAFPPAKQSSSRIAPNTELSEPRLSIETECSP